MAANSTNYGSSRLREAKAAKSKKSSSSKPDAPEDDSSSGQTGPNGRQRREIPEPLRPATRPAASADAPEQADAATGSAPDTSDTEPPPAPPEAEPSPGEQSAATATPHPDPDPPPEPTPQPQPDPAEPPDPSPGSAPAPPASATGGPVQVRDTAPPPVTPSGSASRSQWNSVRPPETNHHIPTAAEVLSYRHIKRRTLNASVPVSCEFERRIDIIRVTNRLERTNPNDFVVVGLDWFLRGGALDRAAIPEPWRDYTGQGTPEWVPYAEDAISRRDEDREMLRPAAPVVLDFEHRLELFRVTNALRRDQRGEIIAVATDRFLRLLGA